MTGNGFQSDPERYQRCARVHLGADAAEKAAADFFAAVEAAREEFGISDVVIALRLHVPKGISKAYAHCGVTADAPALASFALVRAWEGLCGAAHAAGVEEGRAAATSAAPEAKP